MIFHLLLLISALSKCDHYAILQHHRICYMYDFLRCLTSAETSVTGVDMIQENTAISGNFIKHNAICNLLLYLRLLQVCQFNIFLKHVVINHM